MRKKEGCSVVEVECASLAMDLAMEGIGIGQKEKVNL